MQVQFHFKNVQRNHLKNLEKKTVTEKDDYYDVFITCSWMFGSQHNKLIYVNRFL